MAVTIARTPWIDDDGSGTTGTVLNNAIKTELYNQIDGALAGVEPLNAPVTAITAATGLQHNVVIPAACAVLYVNSGALLQITGITAGVTGQAMTVVNLSPQPVEFLHSNTGSTVGNRLANMVASAATTLSSNGSARYVYDGQFWRLQEHEQGAWLSVPYSAANFTGDASMTWTVDSGDVVSNQYKLSGRSLHWNLSISSSSIGGTLTTQVRATLPGGLVSGSTNYNLMPAIILDNGTPKAGECYSIAGTTLLYIRILGATTPLSAATNTSSFYISITHPVN